MVNKSDAAAGCRETVTEETLDSRRTASSDWGARLARGAGKLEAC